MRSLLWLYVMAVALFDVSFFAAHNASLCAWEMNPVAGRLCLTLGLPWAVGLRLGAVALAWLLDAGRGWLSGHDRVVLRLPVLDSVLHGATIDRMTFTVFVVHLLLITYYGVALCF